MGDSGSPYSKAELRELCDDYKDPKKYVCGGGCTFFHSGHLAYIRKKAETALNFYNKKKRSNFRLENVVKVNHFGISLFCLTFWAQRDENAERRLFRGVVWRGDVMLCEIKDGDDDISIPAGHVDDESRKHIRTEANDRLRKWVQEMPDVCSEDESEDDSEDEKYDPGVRDGGVDVAGSAAGSELLRVFVYWIDFLQHTSCYVGLTRV
ncbi:uncharacterized protein [Henckelia pumila]|uniref:uncharacterized protein isoform X2 n=1 Tax=Henckelia pumila TaxID=405737 RepID=UPI003C6E0BD4